MSTPHGRETLYGPGPFDIRFPPFDTHPHNPKANVRQVGGDHYKNMAVEPWDVVDTWPAEQKIGAYRAGALKYLMRMGSKDEQLQEIKKAAHYLEKLIEVLVAEGGEE
jgi:hypothetical protein